MHKRRSFKTDTHLKQEYVRKILTSECSSILYVYILIASSKSIDILILCSQEFHAQSRPAAPLPATTDIGHSENRYRRRPRSVRNNSREHMCGGLIMYGCQEVLIVIFLGYHFCGTLVQPPKTTLTALLTKWPHQ